MSAVATGVTRLFGAPAPAVSPATARAAAQRGRPAPTYDGVDDLLADSRSRLDRIGPRAAYQELLYERAVLIDIRPAGQRRAEGSVDGRLPVYAIERNVLEWRFDPRHEARLPIAAKADRDGLRVIVMCQEGFTSSLAADSLLRLGVRRATDLTGGFAAWAEAGLPLTRLRMVPARA